ncbi:hypothetical protein [Lactiplantibacillus songbeiensis]|uniref:Integral membrane protein n=1 Tax=Lactiplantibacillus songbeiensis TaxID=2559920 RepID=A0ABW4C0E3_9LACO|nr:hypothetical protein [Lactiplantibacillus songbeiensis]
MTVTKDKGMMGLASLVRSKGLLGFIYGVLIIGLYSATQQTASAPILVMTAEVLAWLMSLGLWWQVKRTTDATQIQALQKLRFTYLPAVGCLFFYNPLIGTTFNYIDGIILAFLVVGSFWWYQVYRGHQTDKS